MMTPTQPNTTEPAHVQAYHVWLRFHHYTQPKDVPRQLEALASMSDAELQRYLVVLNELRDMYQHPIRFKVLTDQVNDEILYRQLIHPSRRSHQTQPDPLCDLHQPHYRLNLERCRQDMTFPTDPGDGIDWVKITQLRVMLGNQVMEWQFKKPAYQPLDFHAVMNQRLKSNNPLRASDTVIISVRLSTQFQPNEHHPRGRLIHLDLQQDQPLTIPAEDFETQLLRDKYLALWSLVDFD